MLYVFVFYCVFVFPCFLVVLVLILADLGDVPGDGFRVFSLPHLCVQCVSYVRLMSVLWK